MWRLSFDCRSLPIFSKAGCSDAAANTVNDAGAGPSPEPPHEVTNTNAPRASTRLITRQLNLHVGRLDDGDCGHAGFEVELVDRLTRQQRDEAMRAGLDLDLRRDPVLDHARDDAREPIARGLLDGLSAHLERRPPRFTLTITLGELPDGWGRTQRPERTWAAIIGLLLLAPFIALLGAGLLRALGLTGPYELLASSPTAIIAAAISLFIGIPVAIAMNLWRFTRVGLRRDERAIGGLLALACAPLYHVVVHNGRWVD